MSEIGATVRLGILGAGWFASRRHIPDAVKCPSVTLTALCRRDADSRQRMAEKFGISAEQAFESWEVMLDKAELDAVLIATPNNLHFAQAKAALEHGLHVLLEKPMTITASDANALVVLANEKGLKLADAVNPPYWAHCHRIRRALQNPDMGEVESVAMYWSGTSGFLFGKGERPDNMPGVVPPTMYRADPEQNGGGYFIDGGTHLVSEVLWVTGLHARRVTALMDSTPQDMRTALCIELENGAIATLSSIGDSQYHTRRVRNIFGAANGVITVEGFDFETHLHIHGQESHKFKEADLVSVAGPVENFADAIMGRGELFSPGEHGAHVVEVVEAAYTSASTGKTITL